MVPPFIQHQQPIHQFSPSHTLPPPSPGLNNHHHPNFNPNPKLEFPRFDGTDPKGWIIRAEQYFDFITVEEFKRIKLAGMHFEGKAGVWFRYYQSSRGSGNISWRSFVNDVLVRFENPENRDVLDLFNKLKQEGTVMEYEDKFEELRAMIVVRHKGFSEEYFVSSFISGLKEHIKGSVRMFRPQTLMDAVFLAKQEDARSSRHYAAIQIKTSQGKTTGGGNSDSKSWTAQKHTVIPANKEGFQKQQRSILSSKEILERRERGQCFHCDEKYHPGQNFKAKLYALTGEEPELGEDLAILPTDHTGSSTVLDTECPGEISLNALVGNNSGGTLRFQGSIRGKKVSILIDSGSTHSFVDAGIVKTLGLTAQVVSPLLVTVADESKVIADSCCTAVPLEIQSHKFVNDLRLFPLSNSDVILGVDWLRHHNPITFDYHQYQVKFQREGRWICLQGDAKEGQIHAISGKKIK